MAIFTGRIEDAHYINEKYDTIEILFKSDDPEDNKLYKHIIEADPKSKDFQELQADGWGDKELLDATAEFKRQHAATFNNAVQQRANYIAREMIGLNNLRAERDRVLVERDRVLAEKERSHKEFKKLEAQRDIVKSDIERHHGWLEEKRTLIKKSDEKIDIVRSDIARHHGWLEEKRTLIKKSDEKIDEQQEELAYTESKIKKTRFHVDNALLEIVMNHNEQGDELFKFKLWALDQEFVKSAPKEVKSKIRRVKRITQGIAILDDLIAS
jgi:chromosome segregation ATPase